MATCPLRAWHSDNRPNDRGAVIETLLAMRASTPNSAIDSDTLRSRLCASHGPCHRGRLERTNEPSGSTSGGCKPNSGGASDCRAPHCSQGGRAKTWDRNCPAICTTGRRTGRTNGAWSTLELVGGFAYIKERMKYPASFAAEFGVSVASIFVVGVASCLLFVYLGGLRSNNTVERDARKSRARAPHRKR